MPGILIKGAEYRGEVVDLFVEACRVSLASTSLPADVQTINGHGLIASRAFVDDHVHFRDPGFTEKEDLSTGTRAALAGGFGLVYCQPNTKPIIDNADVANTYWWQPFRATAGTYYPLVWTHAALTIGQQGEQLTNHLALLDLGITKFSDDGEPVVNRELLLQALLRLPGPGVQTSLHCEETPRSRDKILQALGPGEPYKRETELITLGVEALSAAGGKQRLHIQHVSLASSVEVIAKARQQGLKLTAEVTPHHLLLCKDDIPLRNGEPDPNWKMNPPLRTRDDMLAMRKALAAGIIDYVATDHAPHTAAEKARYWEQAPFGVIGLETAFGAYMSLVHSGELTYSRLLSALFAGGDIFQYLGESSDVRLTLVDPNHVWTVDPETFYSKSRNCPFAGMTFKGKPMYTIAHGKLVMAEGEVLF